MFNTVAIIGVGLIGGSMGMEIRKKRLAKKVVGIGRHPRKLSLAKKLGAIDQSTTDFQKGVKGADLVILATPVGTFGRLMKRIKGSLKKGAILIDVGSTKAEVEKEIEDLLPEGIFYVGTHPLAGSEKSGVAFAKHNLFKNTITIICKTNKTKLKASAKIARLWKALGVKVVYTSTKLHDRIVAQISHLPHVVACGLVDCVSGESLKFASTGFRDTTRIASGEPVMWAEVCITNRKQIVDSINRFRASLRRLEKEIKSGNEKKLVADLKKIKNKRDPLNKTKI